MSELIRVEVQRSKWLRGDPQKGCLRYEAGLQCCLGFVAVQAGFAEMVHAYNELGELCQDEDVHDPHALLRDLVRVQTSEDDEDGPSVLGTEIHDDLIKINDSDDIDDATRERRLAEIAAHAGIEFVFVD